MMEEEENPISDSAMDEENPTATDVHDDAKKIIKKMLIPDDDGKYLVNVNYGKKIKKPERPKKRDRRTRMTFGDYIPDEMVEEHRRFILKHFVPHNYCTPACLTKFDNITENIPKCIEIFKKSNNPFLKPLAMYFSRLCIKNPRFDGVKLLIAYIAPCGRLLKTLLEIQHYLIATECKQIDIRYFTLTYNFRTELLTMDVHGYVEDISNGQENIPIALVNSLNGDCDLKRKYINLPQYDPATYSEVSEFMKKKQCCQETCDSNSFCLICPCSKNAEPEPETKDDNDKPEPCQYSLKRLYHYVESPIYECSSECKCPPDCANRVVQLGSICEFQLFKERNKDWAVRSTHFIPRGMFVLPYVGEFSKVRYRKEKNDEYVATVGEYCQDKRGLLKINSSLKTSTSSENEEDFDKNTIVIDGVDMSNLACFVNHSCMPNMFCQLVVVESYIKVGDETFSATTPIFALFSLRDIAPFEELTWDYNYSMTTNLTLPCHCMAINCRASLR